MDRAHARGQEPHAGAAVKGSRGGGGAREATLIAGDGIGPEITGVTLQVLDALGVGFDWDEQYGGVSAEEQAGAPLPDSTGDSIPRPRPGLQGPPSTPCGGGARPGRGGLRQG